MKNHSTDMPQRAREPRETTAKRLQEMGVILLAALLINPLPAQTGTPVRPPILLPPFVPPVIPKPFLQQASPFTIVGFIQSATRDPLCTAHPFCGGTVTVNGIAIVIPQNTIFQFPASAMTWDDMFDNAPPPYKAAGQSGLAARDTPTPLTTYEITIRGNRIINGNGSQYIAGLVLMSQQSPNLTQGFINFINYATGEIWIGEELAPGPTGARIRLNTPHGRYGNPDPNADRRFAADEDNPTIKSATGYPMCVPRGDPRVANDAFCPQWNRPRDPLTGAFSTNFTMPPAQVGETDAFGVTHQAGFPTPAAKPDPFEQAPFVVGDHLTVAGTLMQDAPCLPGQPLSSCQYISAHTITANVAIFTAPGAWPAYTALGEFILSVAGKPNPLFPQEPPEKLVAEVFSTDSTQLVDLYAVDVNPCTGGRSHRLYGVMDPFGPPVSGVKGVGRILSTVGNYLPPTRELRAASRTLTHGAPLDSVLPTSRKTANGLVAGIYLAPIFDFVFAPNLVLGSPMAPLTFEEFPFLVNGSGPYDRFSDGLTFAPPAPTGGAGGLGQLKPWPGLSPLPTACSIGQLLIQAPISNAGPPQTVQSGAAVTLNANDSSDTNTPRLPLIFTWQQSGGPAVSLMNPSLAITTFAAPTLLSGSQSVVLTFQVVACNGYTCGAVAPVSITVTPQTNPPQVTLSASPGQNVTPATRVTLTGTATGGTGLLTHAFAQTAGPAQTLTKSGNTAAFTVTVPAGTALPSTLTFTDKVTDAGVRTSTATISIFVGADTLSVTAASYTAATSTLTVTAGTNALPKGLAGLTLTALGANGVAIGSDAACTYDPVTDTYRGTAIVKPSPAAVRIKSNLGGTKSSPILTFK